MQHQPKKYFLTAAAGLMTAVLAALLYWTRLKPFYAYVLSVTAVTFLAYGYDKYKARKADTRIPEIVLHLLALGGGTAGALMGQIVFRHKIRKIRFLIVFWSIVIVQALLIVLLKTSMADRLGLFDGAGI